MFVDFGHNWQGRVN